jgi:hypothetical protein
MKKPHTSKITILLVLMFATSSVFAQRANQVKYTALPMTGVVTSIKTVDLTALANTPAPGGTVDGTEIESFHHEPLPPPLAPRGARSFSRPAQTSLAPNVAAPLAALNFVGFTGLTHLDQRLTNSGNQFSIEPPDQGLAVGASRIFEAVNDAVNVYNLNGVALLARPLAINEFFNVAPAINRTSGAQGPSIGDPVAFYDATVGTNGRFFFACYGQTIQNNHAQQQSQLYLAVSQTSDPAGLWWVYTIDATDASDPDGLGPRFPDYPHMAADANGVYISVNEFKITASGGLSAFDDAAIYCLRKSSLIAGSNITPLRIAVPYSCLLVPPFTCTDPDNSAFEFTIYPAVTPPGASFVTANNGTQFFSSSDSDNNTGMFMAVWALTNTASLNTASPSLTLSKAKISTQAYNFPTIPGQTQKEGFRPLGLSLTNPGNPNSYPNPPAAESKINAGDDRVQNACSVGGGRLWVALQSEVLDGNNNNHTGAAYFCFLPSFRGGNLSAVVLTQGTLVVNDTNLLRAAIVANTANQGAMVFTLQGLNDYPSSAFVAINDLTVGPINISRAGNVPADGFTGYPAVGGGNGTERWGDYSAAMVNNDGSIYLATMYNPDINRTINANWCTYVTHYSP